MKKSVLPRVPLTRSRGGSVVGVVLEDGNMIACCHHRHTNARTALECSEHMLTQLNTLTFADFFLHAWVGHPVGAVLSAVGLRRAAQRWHYLTLPRIVRATSRLEEIPYRHGLLFCDLVVVPLCLALRMFGMMRWACSFERAVGLDRVADAAKRRQLPAPELPTLVRLIFRCTSCRKEEAIEVPWQDHHTLPDGWSARDIEATPQLPRRTSHIFACCLPCAMKLDEMFPPPQKPKWFPFP